MSSKTSLYNYRHLEIQKLPPASCSRAQETPRCPALAQMQASSPEKRPPSPQLESSKPTSNLKEDPTRFGDWSINGICSDF